MNLLIKLSFVTAFLIFMLSSCSSVEDVVSQRPYLSQLSNTECLNHKDIDFTQNSRSENCNGSFEMIFVDDVAKCKFNTLEYTCDFWKVNVNVSFNDGVLTIVEYPSFDNATCLCEIDASFLIEKIPQQDFILKIYHGDTNGNYNKTTPKYVGRINPAEGKIMIPY